MTYTWKPTEDHVERANVTRLARAHGIGSLEELRRRSVQDVAWFWDAVVEDLGLPFSTPYDSVLDTSHGVEHPDWFVGGRINIADAMLRWVADPATADRAAVVHESENGQTSTLTFRELATQVERVSAGLAQLGIRRGDTVALYLPMIPEAVIACYAVARLGAVLVPLFSGFAPAAITARLQDAEATAVIVADGTLRRRREVAMKPQLDHALAGCPSVQHVIVVGNVGDAHVSGPREHRWADLLATETPAPAAKLDASDTLLLAYTSGTTGRPKGAVHTHAGFLVKVASEVAYSFDVSPGGVFCWVTDMGWIMGPLSIFGAHANGATVLLYEGSPDVPDAGRLWDLVRRHGVTMLGVSPTLARTLRSHPVGEVDLSSVRVLGSTGEPWDPNSYE
ncbi:MAG: AMP-binding protein, partial [Thermocrispum sp.]